jgi:hypothetical protein
VGSGSASTEFYQTTHAFAEVVCVPVQVQSKSVPEIAHELISLQVSPRALLFQPFLLRRSVPVCALKSKVFH